MDKWAHYFISEVSYDSDHLISVAIRHQDTDQGITRGKPIDRLTISSDIINGLFYITIYSGKRDTKYKLSQLEVPHIYELMETKSN